MTASRRQQICLIAVFLALIGIVAPSQIVCELREGEPAQIVELFRQPPTRANLRRLETNLENRCRLAQMVRPWTQYARFVLFEDAGDKALVGPSGWFFYRPAVQYSIEPWSPGAADAQGDIVNAIISFRDQLAKRGIKLLIMPAPNKASIYPEMLAARAAGLSAPVNPTTRDVLAKLKGAGVEIVDLFEVFGAARRESDTAYYLAQDSHWSPEGIRLAAAVVARKLFDAGWVAKGPVQYEMKPVTIERYGDVLRMMRTPRIEGLYKPQPMNCTQVVNTETGKLYEDDPNSPVLVLGDSFLRIFERDEPGSGGFIAHLAYHLGFGLTSLVNDGGASTLVRQQLARKPTLLQGKKVVVWEFVERDIRFGTEGWQVIPLP